MALSTLNDIRILVRQLTRSPSDSQLTDQELDDNVNSFILYDFPETLRLFNLTTNLVFYTEPNVEVYETNTTTPTDPLYDFKNKYISIHPPVYVGGIQVRLCQSQQEFYQLWPKNSYLQLVGTGDGATQAFSGTVPSAPLEQYSVLFTSIDTNNNGIVLVDVPINSQTGNLIVPNDPSFTYGTINYLTGAFSLTFPVAPASAAKVNCQSFPYVASLPSSMLFFDAKFHFRPIPDQVYRVEMQAFIRPTELLTTNQVPELAEWWQYIAYGASRKILQRRMDLETVALIEPEFNKQERLILRRTLVQQSNSRTPTIYQQGPGSTLGYGWFSGNGSF